MTEVERLSRRERAAIGRAVSGGGAVERLAALAVERAVARRQRLGLVCFGVIAPLGLLTWWGAEWLLERDDPDGSGLAVRGGYLIGGTLSLLLWALAWRPLVRAERANRVAEGDQAPRVTRVASGWFRAWGVALTIGWVLGLVLDGLDLSLGPLGVVLVCLLAWTLKLTSDRPRTADLLS